MLEGLTISDEVWRRARSIRLLGIDVDGVLTDGRLHYTDQGESLKSFHVLDGFRIKLLSQSGIHIAVLSGKDSPMLRKRLADWNVAHSCLGLKEKASSWQAILKAQSLSIEQVAFIGDDWIDAPLLKQAGLAVAVPEAPGRIRNLAHYVTRRSGGDGAVAEVAELILDAQGYLESLWQRTLRGEGVSQ
jgi:3-deoxy-D-manno-octulosonate 8-phosphate phosphatase (KDO 8-P phosphatase)